MNFPTRFNSVLAASLVVSAVLVVPSAQAVNVQVKMTVDNSYALYYGTATAATTFVGSDFSWGAPEVYNFNLPANNYLYVVTASDLSVAQGFLGQFENLDTNYKFYSSDPQWQVMATGLGSSAPYSGSASDLTLLSNEIVDANGGGNPSLGWVGLTSGPSNGSAPWGSISGIDAAAKWVWYSSNGDTDPTTPGFNHNEWLVFRIQIGATPTPTPDAGASAALLIASAGALHFLRRRLAA